MALQMEDKEGFTFARYRAFIERLLCTKLLSQVLPHLFTLAFKRPLEPLKQWKVYKKLVRAETRWVLVPFDGFGFPDISQRVAQAFDCPLLAHANSRPFCTHSVGPRTGCFQAAHKAERSKH